MDQVQHAVQHTQVILSASWRGIWPVSKGVVKAFVEGRAADPIAWSPASSPPPLASPLGDHAGCCGFLSSTTGEPVEPWPCGESCRSPPPLTRILGEAPLTGGGSWAASAVLYASGTSTS